MREERSIPMINRVVLVGGGALLALISILVALGSWGSAWQRNTMSIDESLRTIVIVAPGEQRPALRGDDIAVDLETGTVPPGVQRATVQSDKDCAADEQGVSHCLNDLTIGRTQLAIRHRHKMMDEPCFTPTEQLNAMNVATYTALAAQTP
jgi:hypothetical protein